LNISLATSHAFNSYASRDAAVRPTITATSSQAVNPGDAINISIGATDIISRLTFIRMGSATHANDSDQCFIDLAFGQEGQNITAVLSNDTTTLVPSFYMLFACNDEGVPSVGSTIEVM
jgi:hypothetical protein